MNLKECFNAFNGDYNGVMGRLMTEERVARFLRKFLDDKSYDTLCAAMLDADYETAFRAAHTLKGTCANLGISGLQASASEIAEALRGGTNKGADKLLPQVKKDYELTISSINALE